VGLGWAGQGGEVQQPLVVRRVFQAPTCLRPFQPCRSRGEVQQTLVVRRVFHAPTCLRPFQPRGWSLQVGAHPLPCSMPSVLSLPCHSVP